MCYVAALNKLLLAMMAMMAMIITMTMKTMIKSEIEGNSAQRQQPV